LIAVRVVERRWDPLERDGDRAVVQTLDRVRCGA
jgi:hypothetical protein